MTVSKPTIVFVHGAWGGSAQWATLISILQAAGSKCVAVDLPSSGAVPAHANFDQDVEKVRATVLAVLDDAGEDCVVVTHSYGGMVGTQALHGLGKATRSHAADGNGNGKAVLRLLYLTALVFPEESSYLNYERPNSLPSETGLEMDVVDGNATLLNAVECFFNDLPAEEARYWNSQLKTQSIACLESPIKHAAWREIPASYLFCENDAIIPLVMQEKMVAEANAELQLQRELELGGEARKSESGGERAAQKRSRPFRTETINAAHFPQLSKPAEVAEFVQRHVRVALE